jgi:hypothetical protein
MVASLSYQQIVQQKGRLPYKSKSRPRRRRRQSPAAMGAPPPPRRRNRRPVALPPSCQRQRQYVARGKGWLLPQQLLQRARGCFGGCRPAKRRCSTTRRNRICEGPRAACGRGSARWREHFKITLQSPAAPDRSANWADARRLCAQPRLVSFRIRITRAADSFIPPVMHCTVGVQCLSARMPRAERHCPGYALYSASRASRLSACVLLHGR